MKFLLDTHALLWAVSDVKKLELQAQEAIDDPQNLIFVSVISLWELRIKESLKKITLPSGFYKSLSPAGYEILPVTIHHIEAFGRLPFHHRDPFDRMLVAQAKTEQLVLITRDEELKKYDIELLGA